MSETPIASRRLLVEERRRMIVELVEQQGRATVEELATRFGTSTVTIRADLDALARSSAIAGSHGGALPVAPATNDTPLNIKETRWHAQKLRIGQAAAKMIQDGETIILDSGSTTVEIARQIRQMKFESLTVITNALNIAMELTGLPQIRVMMLGGLLRQTLYSLGRSGCGAGAGEAFRRPVVSRRRRARSRSRRDHARSTRSGVERADDPRLAPDHRRAGRQQTGSAQPVGDHADTAPRHGDQRQQRSRRHRRSTARGRRASRAGLTLPVSRVQKSRRKLAVAIFACCR